MATHADVWGFEECIGRGHREVALPCACGVWQRHGPGHFGFWQLGWGNNYTPTFIIHNGCAHIKAAAACALPPCSWSACLFWLMGMTVGKSTTTSFVRLLSGGGSLMCVQFLNPDSFGGLSVTYLDQPSLAQP